MITEFNTQSAPSHSRKKNICIRKYRFFLLPISRDFQPSILDYRMKDIKTLEENKLAIFRECLENLQGWKYSYGELRHHFLGKISTSYVFQLGVKRNQEIFDETFKQNYTLNWPNILLFIETENGRQEIWIQQKTKVFKETDTVLRILTTNFNSLLFPFNLEIHINPVFERFKFWDLVKKYDKKITNVRFELIAPNMEDISKLLDNHKDLMRNTNSQKSVIEIQSDTTSSLNLDPNSPDLNGYVDYSSEGGGRSYVRIKSLKKRICVSDNPIEVVIKDLDISSDNPETIVKALHEILSKEPNY